MAIEFSIDMVLFQKVLTAVIVLIITFLSGKILGKVLKEAFKKSGIPETETPVPSIIKYAMYLIGITIAAGYVEIPIISVWIVIGLASIFIGIGARSSLENIMSGYFLRSIGPFDVGDVIQINGKTGIIKDLTQMKTVIETAENTVYSIPNSKVVKLEIYNFTRYKSDFPVELEFEINKGINFEDVKRLILTSISTFPKMKREKPVKINILKFTEKGILIKIIFFVSDYKSIQGAKDHVAKEIYKKYYSQQMNN